MLLRMFAKQVCNSALLDTVRDVECMTGMCPTAGSE